MNDHVKWLTTCPVGDFNFKYHLERASAQDVREALKIIEGHMYAKTKEKALRAALKKKEG